MVQADSDNARSLPLGFVSVAAILLLWQIVGKSGLVKPIFLPTPGATFQALFTYIASGVFAKALAVSAARIALATTIAGVIGTAIGLLMGVSERARQALSPITHTLRYIPITALLPLLILWFGIGESMKITFLFLGIVFYVVPLVENAVRSTPEEYLAVGRSYGVGTSTLVRTIYVPHALPQIMDGLIVVNGIGWTYVVLAEIINAREGLGYLVNIAGRLQRSDEVFAGLILIAFVAIVSDWLLRQIRQRYLFW